MNARENWLKAQEISNKESGQVKQLPDPMATQTPAAAGSGTTGAAQ